MLTTIVSVSMRAAVLALLALAALSDTTPLYSSFWAPLFDRRILNYRVDATFHPEHAKIRREWYAKEYGFRGEQLIADLGNGRAPGNVPAGVETYGDIKLYYT